MIKCSQSASDAESNILVLDGCDLQGDWNGERLPIEVELSVTDNPDDSIHRFFVTAVGLEPRVIVNDSDSEAKGRKQFFFAFVTH